MADDTGTGHLMACKVWLGFACSIIVRILETSGCILVRSPTKAPASLTRNQSQKALPHTTLDPPATHNWPVPWPAPCASLPACLYLTSRPPCALRTPVVHFFSFFFFCFHFSTGLFSPLARFHVVSRSGLQLTVDSLFFPAI